MTTAELATGRRSADPKEPNPELVIKRGPKVAWPPLKAPPPPLSAQANWHR